jgi:hypothetical protein
MYSVYIVFENGHNIKVGQFEFLQNAELEAQYQAKHCPTNGGFWFEVCHQGDICMSTR